MIVLKRVYEPREPGDGVRVLVERLWPRGIAKTDGRIDVWLKDLAPSTQLRKWFDHDAEKWDEFRRRYFAELDDAQPEELGELATLMAEGSVTFVFAAREMRFNNAVALRQYCCRGRPCVGPI